MVHIALQELKAVAFMLKNGFWLSNKVVALHLDIRTAKAYICNQDGTVFLILSRLACNILNLAYKHVVTLIPTYISITSMWKLCLPGMVGSRVAPALLYTAQAESYLWGQLEVDLSASSHQC